MKVKSLKNAELMFYQHLNENLSDELVNPAGLLEEGEDPMDYVNAQAFRANLMSIDLMSMGHLLYVISFLEEAMHGAFNEDHSKEPEPPQVRDAWVMGAAQWIVWRAEEAFSLVQKPGDPEIRKVRKQFSFLQSRKRDDAVEKKWPYTWNQWQAWKDGFRIVAGSEAYSSTCKTIAKEAADLMGVQEKGMANQQPQHQASLYKNASISSIDEQNPRFAVELVGQEMR